MLHTKEHKGLVFHGGKVVACTRLFTHTHINMITKSTYINQIWQGSMKRKIFVSQNVQTILYISQFYGTTRKCISYRDIGLFLIYCQKALDAALRATMSVLVITTNLRRFRNFYSIYEAFYLVFLATFSPDSAHVLLFFTIC